MLETASCTRINEIIRKKLIKKNSKILHICNAVCGDIIISSLHYKSYLV